MKWEICILLCFANNDFEQDSIGFFVTLKSGSIWIWIYSLTEGISINSVLYFVVPFWELTDETSLKHDCFHFIVFWQTWSLYYGKNHCYFHHGQRSTGSRNLIRNKKNNDIKIMKQRVGFTSMYGNNRSTDDRSEY